MNDQMKWICPLHIEGDGHILQRDLLHNNCVFLRFTWHFIIHKYTYIFHKLSVSIKNSRNASIVREVRRWLWRNFYSMECQNMPPLQIMFSTTGHSFPSFHTYFRATCLICMNLGCTVGSSFWRINVEFRWIVRKDNQENLPEFRYLSWETIPCSWRSLRRSKRGFRAGFCVCLHSRFIAQLDSHLALDCTLASWPPGRSIYSWTVNHIFSSSSLAVFYTKAMMAETPLDVLSRAATMVNMEPEKGNNNIKKRKFILFIRTVVVFFDRY